MIKVSYIFNLKSDFKRSLMSLRQCDLTRLPLKRSLLGDPNEYDTVRIHKQNIEESRPSKFGKNKATKIHSNKNGLTRKPSFFHKVDFENNNNLEQQTHTLITDDQPASNIEKQY